MGPGVIREVCDGRGVEAWCEPEEGDERVDEDDFEDACGDVEVK